MANGLAYLHSVHIIHRDIKSSNFLIAKSKDSTSSLVVKIADFGLSRTIDVTKSGAMKTMTIGVGTPYWSSPEVLSMAKYSEKADVYSFGVTLWEIVNTHFKKNYEIPYMKVHPTDVRRSIKNGIILEIPKQCPELLKFILKKCWSIDEKQRPNIQSILKTLTKLE